ncbi:MAG: GNAT family N-acetyltransferase [Candidatus Hodarchaeota archaeon]
MLNKVFKEDEIIIRNYRTSDYHATLEILKQLHEIYDIGLKEKQWKKSSGLRQFKPNLKRITLIAELKSTGDVVCMGVIEALRNPLGQYIGYLNNWATKKEFIGKGIGKILADKAISILRSWGCESIRINLGYGISEKLIKVFERTRFKPIMIVLEKRFDK